MADKVKGVEIDPVREKLINELANDIAFHCPDMVENGCGVYNCASCLAERLADDGYRKAVQKWIPVTERLPSKKEYTAKAEDGTEYYTLHRYAYHDALYGWHISDLIIYDKPKPLSDFRKPCGNDLYCEKCGMFCNNTDTCGNAALQVKRPPQSWCYVEG